MLQSLDNLSTQGRSILETYYPQIVTQLQTLQAVSSQLAQHQADLAGLLSEIPLADNALPQAVRNGYVQLYENIIVCGLPGGGEDDSQPAFSCAKSGPPARAGAGAVVITRRLVVNLVVFFAVSFGSWPTASSACWATRSRARPRSPPSSPTRRASTRASRWSSTASPWARCRRPR